MWFIIRTQTAVQLELFDDVRRNDKLGWSGFTLFARWLQVSQPRQAILQPCLIMSQTQGSLQRRIQVWTMQLPCEIDSKKTKCTFLFFFLNPQMEVQNTE